MKPERDPLDRYYTPDSKAALLTDVVGPRLKGLSVWEPCVGGGSVANAVERWADTVFTSDIDFEVAAQFYGDFFDLADLLGTEPPYGADWIITNPPYFCAAAMVRRSLEVAHRGVAMLLRLTFLEGCRDREDILATTPLSDLIHLGRVAFEGPAGELVRMGRQSSDQVPSAWFVWDKQAPHANTIIHYPEYDR